MGPLCGIQGRERKEGKRGKEGKGYLLNKKILATTLRVSANTG